MPNLFNLNSPLEDLKSVKDYDLQNMKDNRQNAIDSLNNNSPCFNGQFIYPEDKARCRKLEKELAAINEEIDTRNTKTNSFKK